MIFPYFFLIFTMHATTVQDFLMKIFSTACSYPSGAQLKVCNLLIFVVLMNHSEVKEFR